MHNLLSLDNWHPFVIANNYECCRVVCPSKFKMELKVGQAKKTDLKGAFQVLSRVFLCLFLFRQSFRTLLRKKKMYQINPSRIKIAKKQWQTIKTWEKITLFCPAKKCIQMALSWPLILCTLNCNYAYLWLQQFFSIFLAHFFCFVVI